MPVDRVLFTSNFSKHGAPNWPCMTCRGGHLRLDPASLNHLPTAQSRKGWDHPGHDHDWDTLRAVALVVCDNPKCQEPATVCAEGKWEEDGDWEQQQMEYTAFFLPTHFCPSPPLIEVPDACPEEAHAEIRLAFVSSWSDQAAAANHIRTAVERLLDARRIPKMITRASGRKRLPLHDRIELLKTREPDAYAALMAIKWLGNAGSHTDDLNREDVFKAFDILEVALHDLYVGHAKKIGRLIASINTHKGPPKAKRRSPSAP